MAGLRWEESWNIMVDSVRLHQVALANGGDPVILGVRAKKLLVMLVLLLAP